jgi:4-amino-4-deoxy-L-arabinose transferase-like glycosyltransferase
MTSPAIPGASVVPVAPARTALHVLALFAWLAALAWLRPLTAPDEGRYAGVALAMLRSGDGWVPRLDGLPFFHKPPLFYWIGAAAMRIFGVHEWAARLPSILGGTLAAGALLVFLRRWSDERGAVVSTVVLVTMPFFYIGSQFANLDMLVAGCITATVLAAAHAALLEERARPWRRALALAFGLAALGLLAKGLIGLVLPGAVYAIWCLATRRWRSLRLAAWGPGWIVLIAVAGPWFVGMQLRYPGFFDYFIVTQHFRRFADTGFNNANPFWFYLPVLLGLTLPWAGWIVAGVWTRWRRRTPGPSASAAMASPTSAPARRDIDLLMGIWFVVVVTFFSLPRSKLVGYVLPALPPLAWCVARALARVLPGDAHSWMSRPAWRWSVAAAVVLCLGALGAAARFAVAPGARLPLPVGPRVGAQDRVVMLDRYFYELPFYWGLRRPVLLLGDWGHLAVAGGDDWRREVADAGRFEPDVARRVLIGPQDLARLRCDTGATWLVGESADSLRAIGWADTGLVPVARNARMAVWRIDAGTGCGAASPAAPPG